VTCTNCGAKLATRNPIAPGKKMNCPKCKETFVVEEDEEKEDEEETPKKKPVKSKEDGVEKPAKKSNALLFVGIAGVLLLCCCGGTGAAGWFMQSTIKGWFGGKIEEIAKDGGKDKKKDDKTKSGDPQKDKDAKPGSGKPDFTPAFPSEVSNEFRLGPINAAKKYKGKVVEFNGKVGNVGLLGPERKPGIALADTIGHAILLFTQPADRDVVFRIPQGESIKLSGRYKEHTDSAVLFEDVKLIEV